LPKLSSLLLKIPDEFKPIAALCIGAFIMVLLVLFHGVSLHRIRVLHRRWVARMQSSRPHVWEAEFLFGWAIFLMLGLHIFGIAAWAFALVHLGLVLKAIDALYFCANAYTTLGYGVVDLGANWRIISPIIAICGLFTFAWTTSSLVGMVTLHLRLLEQLEIERAKEKEMRKEAHEAAWEAYTKEEITESASRAEAKKRAATASFFERRRIWREERRNEEELRAQVNRQADELRHHERLEEEKLGQDLASGDAPEAKDNK
jgi:Ion channel